MTEFDNAISILKTASRSGSRLGLERIYTLCALLGDPQDKPKTIHVAGTNGKGSFCAMLSSVLTAQGYMIGTFSSPVMLKENDCIRIDGVPVSEEVFADAVIRTAEVSKQMPDEPTEFELLTAAAFLIFAEQGCEFTVIECGMGGDGDSTNVIGKPLLSVITNVTLDHCAFLGHTVAEIAGHKAGIIKEGIPVYFGRPDKEALDVIKPYAERKGAELYTSGSSFGNSYTLKKEGKDSYLYNGERLVLPLKGSYQAENLRNVLNCVEILREKGIVISDKAVRKGITEVSFCGRFEKLADDPLVIFDGAHNPDGMRSLCESIKTCFGDVSPVILIGVLADKDYRQYADMLRPLVLRAFAIAPDNHRALEPAELARCFIEKGIPTEPFNTVKQGFEAAYCYCREHGLPLLVIGSLYLYGDIVKQIKTNRK